MILPASIFAYDTETDRLDPDDPETTYCALVQICPIDAQSVDDVTLFESDHAVDDFLAAFERTPYDCEMHCYNLGNYEFEWIRGALIRRGYHNIQMDRRRKLPPMTWRTIYDKAGVFRVDVVNQEGYILRIKDDMKLFDPSQSMESVAKSVRKEHPEWFEGVDVVKETVAYNSGWHFYPDRKESKREEFLYYSKLDAFSQSRITKYLVEEGLNDKLSSTSTTLRDALEIIYPDIPEEWKRMRKFAKQYPPLDEEMQDYAESRLIGGFVWGEVGTFHGTFSKFDYKSSYPYEYVFGKLPRGKIGRFPYSDPKAKLILQHKGLLKWLRVSFDFKLKEGMMPCINAKEAGICHFVNRKMSDGHVEDWLYNENLFNEIGMHYDLSNVNIIEVWFSKSETGRFAPAIRHFFDRKEISEKGSAMYSYAKKGMNGGIHGKTITKTHRQSRVFREDGEDNEDALWVDSVSKPKLCFMIGFTALENARCRLLHDCRMMIEHGFHVYMCDTDSMIVDATPEQAKEILGEKLIYPESSKGKEMEDILGKFELECVFDEFKCWGLKRYLQLRDGEFVGSAFAGMHDEVQREELKNWKTDGTIYEWQQKVKVRLKREHGVTIEIGTKKAGAMNVWFKDDLLQIDRSAKRLMENDERFGMQYNLDMWKDQYNQLMLDTAADEDMISYLQDIRYDEIDPYWRRHVKKAYLKAKKEEMKWE